MAGQGTSVKIANLKHPLKSEDPEKDKSYRWFHGCITGVETEKCLTEKGENGSFLIRASQTQPGKFVLSVWNGDKVRHIRLRNIGNFFDLGGGPKFATLKELAESLIECPQELLMTDGEFIDLGYPVMSDYPTTESWFHGFLSTMEAENCLMGKGGNGSFLVRASHSKPDDFVLSVRNGDEVCHHKINYQDRKYDIGESEQQFSSLSELVDFYRDGQMEEMPVIYERVQLQPEPKETTYTRKKDMDAKDKLEQGVDMESVGRLEDTKCLGDVENSTDTKCLRNEDKNEEKHKRIFRDAFTRATSSGDKDELVKLLADSDSLKLRSFIEGCPSVFHDVCAAGFLDVAHILLNHGADINSVVDRMTPLQGAAASGNLEVVRYLISEGATVMDDVCSERSAFYLASRYGHSDVVLELTAHYPSHVAEPTNRSNLVYAACKGGNLAIVQFWYIPQMDLNLPAQQVTSLKNCENMRPLYAACEGKHLDVAKFLVENGVTISASETEHFPDMTAKLLEGCFHAKKKNKIYAEMNGLQLTLVHAVWFEQYRHRLTTLDLSDNRLNVLPSLIPWELPSLQILNLCNNRLQVFDGPATTMLCRNLKKLNLSNNKLKNLCADLFSLPSLTTLDLSTNKLKELTKPSHDIQTEINQPGKAKGKRPTDIRACRWNLPCLTHLNVRDNTLVMIPEEIRTCHALAYLDASDNELFVFISPWKCPLQVLNLSHNYMDVFPDRIEEFWSSSLLRLNLHDNCLQQIGESIVKLSSLRILDLSSNEIDRLPKPSVWDCRYLESLNLANNNLGVNQSDEEIMSKKDTASISPKTVKGLFGMLQRRGKDVSKELEFPEILSPSLKYLYLRNNNLDHVPLSVCKLQRLCRLDISQNRLIKTLPRGLGLLTQCKELVLSDNNIIDPDIPGYLLSPLLCEGSNPLQCSATKDLLVHLNRLQRKCEPNKRLKLVVVGPQDKGKSTLLRLLKGTSGEFGYHVNRIHTTEWRLQEQKILSANKMEILFNVWELSGHPDLNIIRQCFLTKNTLYFLVFDLRKDVHQLHEWLCQLQASAHKDSVILIGTFNDKLDPKAGDMKSKQLEDIKKQYSIITCYQFVSCATKTGISDLKKIVYRTATNMTNAHSRKENFVGMKIPLSYLLLIENVSKMRTELEKFHQPPIMTEEGFKTLLEDLPENEVIALDDVSNALQYLVEVGCLLHFNEQLQGLNSFYFLDPVWLQDILALIVVDSGQAISSATISMANIEERLKRENFPDHLLPQCLRILKMFGIAVETANGRRLLFPSKLPKEPPMVSAEMNKNVHKIYRLYKLMYIPPVLWSRFIIGLLETMERFSGAPWFLSKGQDVKRRSSELHYTPSSRGLTITDKDVMFWREGIRVAHEFGNFLVESVNYHIPDCEDLGSGILITIVSQDQKGLSAIGIIVDELDDILRDFFPGFQDFVDEFPSAYAVCPSCYQSIKTESGIVVHIDHFDVQTCALTVLSNECIRCPKGSMIALEDLVPEMLFKELPKKFFLDTSRMSVSEKPLGNDSLGAVYPGRYGNSTVALKIFHKIKPATASCDKVDSGTSSTSNQGSQSNTIYDNALSTLPLLDEANSFKAYKAFAEVRKEVAILSKLRHPCIVSFLGLSVQPDLYIATELAKLGSLRDVLDEEMSNRSFSNFTDKHKTYSSVFCKDITFMIIYQVGNGLEYLHEHSIIYRDLKSDNVQVYSLDDADTVNVKLSDYGISKFSTTQGLSGFVGTLGYMAPEILNGQTYTEKVDIFSFSMLMYEVLSGHRPFDDCLNLAQAVVKQKKRPDIRSFSIVPHFPYLEYLMSVCWNHDANERPSAADITMYMRHHQFVCQYEVLTLPEPEAVFSDVTCSAVISETDLDIRHHQLWVWEATKKDTSRHLSIYNFQTNSFQVLLNSCPGAHVRCMLKVGEFVFVGTDASEIELFGSKSFGGTHCEDKLTLSSIPRLMVGYKKECEQDSYGYVFVALDNGAVTILSHQPRMKTPTKMWKLVKTITLSTDQAVCRMTLVSQGNELWVACGHIISIVSTQTLLKEENIDLMENDVLEIFGEEPQIQQLVCDGDIVWCSFRFSSKILEYNAPMRQVMYCLDIWKGEFKCQYLGDLQNPDHDSEDTYMQCNKKVASIGSRRLLTEITQESSVSSMLVVDDTIWVGTNSGTIVVIGFKDNQFKHPRLKLTELKSVSSSQGKSGPVTMLIEAGGLVVSSIRMGTGHYKVQTEISAWEAAESERLADVEQLWVL